MPKIKLLAPIKHNGEDLSAGDVIDVNESQASRLIKLSVAACIEKQHEEDVDDADPISIMTKKECMSELSAASVVFNDKAKVDELREMVRKLHSSAGELPGDGEKHPNDMNREELESELTILAIDFSAENSDEELRKLLTDALSDNE